MTVRDIQDAVARHFGVPASIMRLPDRRGTRLREWARPRQVAMFLASELAEQPRTVVARQFRRDHSTLIYAEREIARRRETDAELARSIEEIKAQLSAVAAAQHIHIFDECSPCGANEPASIESSMEQLTKILGHIDDPAVRKIVIMAKRERGELTDAQTEQLIRLGGLADA